MVSNLAPRVTGKDSRPEEDSGHKIVLISLGIYSNVFLLCNHLKANSRTLFLDRETEAEGRDEESKGPSENQKPTKPVA